MVILHSYVAVYQAGYVDHLQLLIMLEKYPYSHGSKEPVLNGIPKTYN